MSISTVRDLMEHLEGLDQDAEIRVAYQQNYPLLGTLANVAADRDVQEQVLMGEEVPVDAEMSAVEALDEATRNIVWLAVGSAPYNENPYAPVEAWDASSW